MKQKFTIQSDSIFYNNETINIVYLDNKTTKYTLYQKETENSDTYDETLFKKFEFDDSFQIAPKKKFSNITFTYFKDEKTNMFQVKYNNKFLYYHVDTSVNFVYDSSMNVLQADGSLYTKKNTLTKTLNIFDDDVSIKENNVEDLVENKLNHTDEDIKTVIEEVKPIIVEEEVQHVVEEEVQPVIIEEEVKTDIVEEEVKTDIVEEEVKTDIIEEEVKTDIVEEEVQPVIIKEEVKTVIVEEEVQPVIVEEEAQPVIVEEEAQPVIVEEEVKTDIVVEEKVEPVVEKIVIQEEADIKQVIETKQEAIQEHDIKQESLNKEKVNPKEEIKSVSFSEETFTFKNIIEDFIILDKVISKKMAVKNTEVKNTEVKKINYHKITYNHNNVNYNLNTVKISPIKQNTNLVNQVIEDSNIFTSYDNAIELDNNNNNYIILLNKIKYLVNKKETVLTFINLQTKNILSVNNKDYFKLENINYLLANNGSLIIPVETKKFFDNNNGTSYNVFVPKNSV